MEKQLSYLEQAKKFFANDLYETECTGITIEAAEPGYAKCSLAIEPRHCNALGNPMGGAIFTLADFAFAIASNLGQAPTVSLSSNITYLSAAKGKKLFAETAKIKSGYSTCLYQIQVYDELGTQVAHITTNGFISRKK